MCELYFDNVKDILEACNTAKPLSDCEDVLCLLKDENIQGNPYRLLAEKFQNIIKVRVAAKKMMTGTFINI